MWDGLDGQVKYRAHYGANKHNALAMYLTGKCRAWLWHVTGQGAGVATWARSGAGRGTGVTRWVAGWMVAGSWAWVPTLGIEWKATGPSARDLLESY